MQASPALLAQFPSSADLLAPAPGGGGLPRWEVDPVLAAEMQFRMRMLGPCMPLLAEVLPLLPP